MSTSSMYTFPSLGLSSPPIMLNSVLLPEPLGPMIEMYSPRLMEMETPFSACTISLPIVYWRFTLSVRTVYSEIAEVIWSTTLIQHARESHHRGEGASSAPRTRGIPDAQAGDPTGCGT